MEEAVALQVMLCGCEHCRHLVEVALGTQDYIGAFWKLARKQKAKYKNGAGSA